MLAAALRGAPGALDARQVPGTFVLPFGAARRLLPRARVLEVSDRSAEAVEERWQAARRRYLEPGAAGRVLVVRAGGGQVARPVGDLRDGVHALETTSGAPVLVVARGGVTTAFRRPEGPADITLASSDPWTGAPWLWSAARGALWDGWTGRALHPASAAALVPAVSFHLSAPAYRAIFAAAP